MAINVSNVTSHNVIVGMGYGAEKSNNVRLSDNYFMYKILNQKEPAQKRCLECGIEPVFGKQKYCMRCKKIRNRRQAKLWYREHKRRF